MTYEEYLKTDGNMLVDQKLEDFNRFLDKDKKKYTFEDVLRILLNESDLEGNGYKLNSDQESQIVLGDWMVEDISSTTTDERIEELKQEYETQANEYGRSWGGLLSDLTKYRNELRAAEEYDKN